MLFDLHVHSDISPCSRLPLGQILAHARARGLDGVCVTDHDTLGHGLAIEEGLQPDGLCLIFGMEYATSEGDFLLFGPFADLAPGLGAEPLLDLVRQRGGAAVGAHPFRAGRPLSERIVRQGLCRAVEGLNGRNSAQENALAANWRERFGVALCGGSDAHSLEELGRSATRFDGPVTCSRDLILAINQGRCRPHALRSGA